jgi:hypothetical protein
MTGVCAPPMHATGAHRLDHARGDELPDEWTTPRGAWRAYRQIRTHRSTVRLAPTQELTNAVLEQAARALHASLTT